MSSYGQCIACGKTFRSAIAEARHRHNFPTLCIRNKKFEEFQAQLEAKRLKQNKGVDTA